jgi:hypothetical protein
VEPHRFKREFLCGSVTEQSQPAGSHTSLQSTASIRIITSESLVGAAANDRLSHRHAHDERQNTLKPAW